MKSSRLLRGWNGLPVYIAIAALSFLINRCTTKAEETKQAPSAPVNSAVPVDGYIVKPVTRNDRIEIAGTVSARQEVAISSELQKKITRVNVREGARVQQGAVLFELDDADLRAQLDKLHQQQKLLVLNENRLSDLLKNEAVTQQDYDQANTNLQVLRAEIKSVEVTLSKTRIRAPFSGRIGIIRVFPGTLVSPNMVLANIVDDASVKVEFAVPEKYARFIPVGSSQPFTIESDSLKHTALITAREALLDEGTRTLLMRGTSDNTKGLILPGQSARVSLSVSDEASFLMVPTNALLPGAEGYSLMLLKGGVSARVPVQVGLRDAQSIQVTRGVASGDTVITTNLMRLMPGMPVSIVKLQ